MQRGSEISHKLFRLSLGTHLTNLRQSLLIQRPGLQARRKYVGAHKRRYNRGAFHGHRFYGGCVRETFGSTRDAPSLVLQARTQLPPIICK